MGVAFNLKNLRVNRVALVDKGANFDPKSGDGARILLYKRAGVFNKIDLTDNDKRTMVEAAAQAKWGNADEQKYVWVRDLKADTAYVNRDGKTYGVAFTINDTGDVTFDGDGVEVVTSYAPLVETPDPTKKEAPALSAVHVDTIANQKKKRETAMSKIQELGKRFMALLKDAGVDDGASDDPMETMKAQHSALGKAIDGMGDVSKLAADHPVHAMKAAYDAMAKVIDGHKPAAPAAEATPAADPEVAKRFTAIEKQLKDEVEKREKAEAIVTKMAGDKALDDERAVLKSFKGVSVDIEKDAPMLVTLKKSDPAGYDRYIAILTAADATIAKSGMFVELGSGQTGSQADAATRLEKMARDRVTKSTDGGAKKISYEKAYTQVCDENPKLVLEMRGQGAAVN